MNTTAGRGIIKFLFVLLIIFLLMPGDIAGIHAQSKKNLFISDLHPERGKNKELLKHLKTKKREGYHIFFLGDCRQYPDHYRRIPHTAIQGNHESFFKNLPATLTLGKDILLVHGHNAEKKFQGPIKFLWEAKFFSYAHR